MTTMRFESYAKKQTTKTPNESKETKKTSDNLESIETSNEDHEN